MSAFIDDRARATFVTSGIGAVLPWRAMTAAAAIFASVLVFVMYWPGLLDVWRTGAFHDTDDAMRLAQVRSLMAGQPWFDMTAYRLDPPLGSFMHWSRLVDAPIAGLIEGFMLFTTEATAETLARLVFPFALLLGFFGGVARMADTLYGPLARLPLIAATLFCGAAIVQFQPGRIDHHEPQILILVFMVGTALAALESAKARQAAATGLLVALSLAISLENLPFIACLAAMLVLFWIWHGAVMSRMLGMFGAGLAVGLVPLYAATVAPDRWFAPVCDAFGAAHLGAGLIGAVGCGLLAVASRRLPWRAQRLAAAGTVAACVIGYVACCYPACLHDPFVRVDPLVREVWISNVTESLPFLRYFRQSSTDAAITILPVVLGLCGCIGAVLWQPGLVGRRYLVLAALTATGLAMAFWQIRCFTSVTPLAICGALPAVVTLYGWLLKRGRDLMAILALCLVFPFTSFAWGMVLPDGPALTRVPTRCLAATSFAPLAALPSGRVLAPIDAGSYLLAHTGMSVFSAPYHRNNDGNRFALDTLMAVPDRAHDMLVERGAAYVMLCAGFGETDGLARRAPDGLAAALIAGAVPAGFQRLAVPGTPFAVYKVLPRKK